MLHGHRRHDGSPYYTAGRYARFARTEQTAALTPPGLGEHSREVLAEIGLDPAAIDALAAAGVIVDGEPMRLGAFFEYR